MLLTYKYRMYPSKNQERLLSQRRLKRAVAGTTFCLAERKGRALGRRTAQRRKVRATGEGQDLPPMDGPTGAPNGFVLRLSPTGSSAGVCDTLRAEAPAPETTMPVLWLWTQPGGLLLLAKTKLEDRFPNHTEGPIETTIPTTGHHRWICGGRGHKRRQPGLFQLPGRQRYRRGLWRCAGHRGSGLCHWGNVFHQFPTYGSDRSGPGRRRCVCQQGWNPRPAHWTTACC